LAATALTVSPALALHVPVRNLVVDWEFQYYYLEALGTPNDIVG
jgi:hypothetical protein